MFLYRDDDNTVSFTKIGSLYFLYFGIFENLAKQRWKNPLQRASSMTIYLTATQDWKAVCM